MNAPLNQTDDTIAFIDLKAQQARIRPQVEERLRTVLDHGAYINGPEIEALEAELARRSGAAAVVGVASGTDALIIAMMALGIGAGDAVFVPGFTYNATANAVLLVGARPVFVDIDRRSFNIDPQDLARRVDEVKSGRYGPLTPRAVVPVDLYGLPADYPAINALAAAENLHVIADAAQSFGGEHSGTKVGALAPITGTSFFPSKTLGGYGDGGAIFTTDAGLVETLISIRWHGTDPARKESIRVGLNGRLDTFQAAVLLEKLAIFEDERDRRRALAARYDALLGTALELPARPDGVISGWGLYTIAVENRAAVQAGLKEAGIPSAVYYTQTLPQMQAFTEFAPPGGLPVAEALTERVLSLPFHPYLSDSAVERVCEVVLARL